MHSAETKREGTDNAAQCIRMFLAVVSSGSHEVNVLIMANVMQVCIQSESKAHTLQSVYWSFSFPCLPKECAKVMFYCLPSTKLSRELVTVEKVWIGGQIYWTLTGCNYK